MNLLNETDTLISVVTVSYNAVSTIEQTILSVINQTYPNVEYIIIDGGSTDGTVDIIKKYADKIAYWVSEPDKGIYDAMNKGGLKTTGDFIQFLNAGDWLENEHVIEKIFKDWFKRVDVIYGDMIIRRSDGVYYAKAQDLSHFENDFPLFHPSTFIARSVFVIVEFINCERVPLQRIEFRLFLPGLGNEQVGGRQFVSVVRVRKCYFGLALIFRIVWQYLYIQIFRIVHSNFFDYAPFRSNPD